MAFWGSKPKSYEMTSGANVTPAVFRNDAFATGLASDLEKNVGYIDANLVLGDQSYVLRHKKVSIVGYTRWSVEAVGPKGENMDKITEVLLSTVGGQRQPEQPEEKGRVKNIVTATSSDVNLQYILQAMNKYEGLTNGTLTVSGYRFEELSQKQVDRVKGAGLPLQEVKS